MWARVWPLWTYVLSLAIYTYCTQRMQINDNTTWPTISYCIASIYTDLNLKLVKLQINTWSLTAQYITIRLYIGIIGSTSSCLCVYYLSFKCSAHSCHLNQLTMRAICWQLVYQCAACNNRVQHWSQYLRAKWRSRTTPARATALLQASDISTEQMHCVEAPVWQRL